MLVYCWFIVCALAQHYTKIGSMYRVFCCFASPIMGDNPANTTRWPNVISMSAQRRRPRYNIKIAFGQLLCNMCWESRNYLTLQFKPIYLVYTMYFSPTWNCVFYNDNRLQMVENMWNMRYFRCKRNTFKTHLTCWKNYSAHYCAQRVNLYYCYAVWRLNNGVCL